MSEQPPPRLLDSAGLDPRLRRDLELSRVHPSVPFDGDAALERFKASLEGTAGPSSGAPGTTSHALKIWGLSTLTLTLLGAVWLALPLSRSGGASPQPHPAAPMPEPEAQPSAAELAPTPSQPSALAEPSGEAPIAAPKAPMPPAGIDTPKRRVARARGERASATARRQARAPASPEQLDPDARKLREIRQLAEARAALDAHPALTLQLARRGQREFSDGMFVQERSALIVFALDALGRSDAAQRAADAYLRRYAHGPFSERVRAIAERPE